MKKHLTKGEVVKQERDKSVASRFSAQGSSRGRLSFDDDESMLYIQDNQSGKELIISD